MENKQDTSMLRSRLMVFLFILIIVNLIKLLILVDQPLLMNIGRWFFEHIDFTGFALVIGLAIRLKQGTLKLNPKIAILFIIGFGLLLLRL